LTETIIGHTLLMSHTNFGSSGVFSPRNFGGFKTQQNVENGIFLATLYENDFSPKCLELIMFWFGHI
jgi:hypothetical protein